MSRHIEKETREIRRLAVLVSASPRAFDYRMRIAIERAVFNVARDIATSYLNVRLTGFSPAARNALDSGVADLSQTAAYRTLTLAFELASVGATLSSGNAYARKELTSTLAGFEKAMQLFTRRLCRYAEVAETLGDPRDVCV